MEFFLIIVIVHLNIICHFVYYDYYFLVFLIIVNDINYVGI